MDMAATSPTLAIRPQPPDDTVNAHPRRTTTSKTSPWRWTGSAVGYRELLSDEERCFIADFAGLPVRPQRWWSDDHAPGRSLPDQQAHYAEIAALDRRGALIERGWLDPHPRQFPDLCRLLRKAELWSALGLRGAARSCARRS